MARHPGGFEQLQYFVGYTLADGDVTPQELADLVASIMGARGKELVMTTAEKLMKEGEEKGAIRERREILMRQLRVRFGHLPQEIQARIRQAQTFELDSWLERVLTASTLDDVFSTRRT